MYSGTYATVTNSGSPDHSLRASVVRPARRTCSVVRKRVRIDLKNEMIARASVGTRRRWANREGPDRAGRSAGECSTTP